MKVIYGRGFVQPAMPLVADQDCVALIDPASGELIAPSGDPLRVRRWIFALGRKLLACGEKRELEVKHTFLDGVYMRELFIPKGTLLVGKPHKLPCMNLVSKGDISVLTESGSARVKAGYSVVSPAGIQKVGYAHEDTVFVNVFRTDETDEEKIEHAIAWEVEAFEALTDSPEESAMVKAEAERCRRMMPIVAVPRFYVGPSLVDSEPLAIRRIA